MDDITASIIVTCQTAGAIANVSKLKYSLLQLGRHAIQFGMDSVAAFRDSQDAVWKFSKTFPNYMGSANKAVREFAKEYNLADVTARKMLTDSSQLMKGMGFSELESLNLGEEISRWGVDLASFTGYAGGAEGATQAIIAALAGENDRLKALGIVLREDTKEFRDLVKQMQEEKGVTEQRARVYAKLAMIKRQAKDAEGDYKAEGENFTQNIKIIDQAILQIKSNLGEMIYEFMSLNDLAGESGGGLQKFANDWKEQSADINHDIRVFALQIVGLFDVIAALTKPIWKAISISVQNYAELAMWLWENYGKLYDNLGNLTSSFLRDMFENFKKYMMNHIMLAVAVKDAIKKALKGEKWAVDLGNLFEYGFSNTKDANKRMDLTKLNVKVLTKDDIDIFKAYNAALDRYEAGVRASEARRDRQKAAAAAGDKKGKEEETAAADTTPKQVSYGLKDIAKDLYKFKTAIQSSVATNSTEALRLQNRRFFNPAGDTQQNTYKELKTFHSDVKTTLSYIQRALNGGLKIAGITGVTQY